tara:strand:- start:1716 stop:2048 length:333 start_codon:yes stop_codon:yes gene_type:complete
MKYTYKNAQENLSGSIDCEILLGDEWQPHTQDPLNEYELSEESEWPNIKLCDQAEKDAYEAMQLQDAINQESMKYLNDTDKFFTRFGETGKAMPEGMAEARSAARERIVI